MNYTLQSLAETIEGTLFGDPNVTIKNVRSIEKAQTNDLTFLLDAQYLETLKTTQAACVVLKKSHLSVCKTAAIVVKDVRASLAQVLPLFASEICVVPKIHPTAVIAKSANIANTAHIGAGCVIGENVSIGEQTCLEPNVTIFENVRIGKACHLKSGCVIGSSGFGFTQISQGWVKLPHLGGVFIADAVHIGANTTIDCGLLEDTRIESGVIIDNLVQIAHNVEIGEKTAIAGCVGIAGSTKIGKRCLIGGGAGIAGHLKIADDVHITGTTAIHKSIEKSGVYSSGIPASPSYQWRRNVIHFESLDQLAKRLKALEKNRALTDLDSKG